VSQIWNTLGVVVPAPVPLPWAVSHAALPVVQARPDGRLRLFCSSRDVQGRSQVAAGWLDLHRGTSTFDGELAIGLGPLGAFDDNGVTSSCVVEHQGRLFQYYTGWSLGVTVPFYLAVGCTSSEDGQTFRKVSPAPVLGRSEVDPFLTASPSVMVENGQWRMWYVSCSDWRLEAGAARHRYHIKYAESADGVEWRPTGRVCIDYRDPSETAIARPCVIKDGEIYRMWYCTRGAAYRLGYAESLDGLVWQRRDEEVGLEPAPGGWNSEMQAYPFVFDQGRDRHLLYNGNGYGATGIGHAVLRSGSAAAPRSP
jgi:hypothetical protein